MNIFLMDLGEQRRTVLVTAVDIPQMIFFFWFLGYFFCIGLNVT